MTRSSDSFWLVQRCNLVDYMPQVGSQPQAGSQAASQPQAGSQPLSQPRLCFLNIRENRPLIPLQPVGRPQQGSATSQPQVGAQAASQPHAGSQQPVSQPPRCFENKRLRRPHFGFAQGSQHESTTSLPQLGAQGASHPHAGSTSQQVSQAPLLHNLSNRPNALALAELAATIATANRAGTITRRIVRSPWI